MREIGIHFKNEVVTPIHRPLETIYVSSAKSQFSFAFFQKNRVIKFWLKASNDVGGAIRRAIINHKYMKSLFHIIHRLKYSFDIFFFVVRRNYDQLFQCS